MKKNFIFKLLLALSFGQVQAADFSLGRLVVGGILAAPVAAMHAQISSTACQKDKSQISFTETFLQVYPAYTLACYGALSKFTSRSLHPLQIPNQNNQNGANQNAIDQASGRIRTRR